jgi:hypothetical protein
LAVAAVSKAREATGTSGLGLDSADSAEIIEQRGGRINWPFRDKLYPHEGAALQTVPARWLTDP